MGRGESYIVDGEIGAPRTYVVGFLHLVAVEIDYDNAKTAAKIGATLIETNAVNVATSGNGTALDVGDIIYSVVLEEVDIGVVVGHYKIIGGGVVGDGGDAYIVEEIDFVETMERLLLKVVVE